MARRRERMASVDIAWLRMDRPQNHMMIVGLLILADRIDVEELKQLIERRWLRYSRFRQRVDDDVLGPVWVDQRNFDLDLHLQLTALPARAGKRELEMLVSNLASTPLDPGRPRWKFHVVEKYGRGSAIILRMHHCYADGIAMVRVLLSMTAGDRAASRDLIHDARAPGEHAVAADPSSLAWLASLYPPAADIVDTALQQGRSVLGTSIELARKPEKALGLARRATGLAGELAKLALLSPDPATSLRGTLSGHKIAAWARPLPLERAKALARRLGCTVNDVLMSLIAAALGEHLRTGGALVAPDLAIRASVPVNLRPANEEPKLGNRFGLVFVTLPVGETDPVARVRLVHDAMAGLKQSYQPVLVLTLLSALGAAPEAMQEPAVDLFSSKASLVLSNVPGPRDALYLAGSRIAEQMFWVPQSGSIGIGVSILTYAGRMHFGLIADRTLISQPRRVVNRVAGALAALESAVAG
jgi:WS/DGAT/MGAT family acyltransferase